jgi:dTDP-4-dehydrorhamnose 3,5-epimerase
MGRKIHYPYSDGGNNSVKFEPTFIDGLFVIRPEIKIDDRGSFHRTFCESEFAEQNLATHFLQTSCSFNTTRGTFRGLHWQESPHAEVKLVRCVFGGIFDIAVDLRPLSKTYLKWFGIELSSSNRLQLYIPRGLAHGFLTLADNTEVLYNITPAHAPESARGARWNDPALQITLPIPITVISERDKNYPDFEIP